MKNFSLAQLPLILTAAIGTAVLVGVAVLYAGTSFEVADQRGARHQLTAEKLALQVAAKLDFQQSTLAQQAQMEEVIGAAVDENPARRQQLSDRLERQLPHAWKLRLVSAGFKETDSDARPPIGYADLDLINISSEQAAAPLAIADAASTPQARIVQVEPVLAPQSERVLGHLLLATRFSLVAEEFAQLVLDEGYAQLQQPSKEGDPQVLVAKGNQALAVQTAYIAPVSGSQWQVAYWPAQTAEGGGFQLILFAGVAVILLLALAAVLFIVGGGISRAISADLATIVTMVREAKSGELKSVYPSQAKDVVGTIHTLRGELSGLRAAASKPKSKPKPQPQSKAPTRPVDDTPDIDLDLDLD